MAGDRTLRIGITCYPSVGGSGILATELGEELAARGHEIHFISYDPPFRLKQDAPRVHFHPVQVKNYDLFKYPDYTLPLSVKMAEVSRAHRLDLLHVHYAVPHATAAVLAQDMLPPGERPGVITTLHGTDTTLLGRDPGYGPAIRHALDRSDAVTAVSDYLRGETLRLLGVTRPIEVIHNFFEPKPATRSRDEIRTELGLRDEAIVLHLSNLRSVKRIPLLLEAASRIKPRDAFKLVILAGSNFAPFEADVKRLGLEDRVIVRANVIDIESYLQAADVGFFTSESESFCLSILEAMNFACPSVSTRVGGIPELVEDGVSGVLVPSADPDDLARAVEGLLRDPNRRAAIGEAARSRARERFSAASIVPRYEALYHRVCAR
ncbi:MAG TPA: N-acetyl-alpha-D-glucosaminyl L-malate synthase BshA [Opitutaceae bacterium]